MTRVENGAQALLKAQSALQAHNLSKIVMEATTLGITTLAAGNVITVTGFGATDGTYLIERARHRLSPTRGYTTDLVACQVAVQSGT